MALARSLVCSCHFEHDCFVPLANSINLQTVNPKLLPPQLLPSARSTTTKSRHQSPRLPQCPRSPTTRSRPQAQPRLPQCPRSPTTRSRPQARPQLPPSARSPTTRSRHQPPQWPSCPRQPDLRQPDPGPKPNPSHPIGLLPSFQRRTSILHRCRCRQQRRPGLRWCRRCRRCVRRCSVNSHSWRFLSLLRFLLDISYNNVLVEGRKAFFLGRSPGIVLYGVCSVTWVMTVLCVHA